MTIEKEFAIGTIVFVKLKDKVNVHPCLITEKSRTETLSGVQISYSAILSDSSNLKFSTETDTIEVFETVDDLQAYLAEQLTTAVSNMVKKALQEEENLKHRLEDLRKTD